MLESPKNLLLGLILGGNFDESPWGHSPKFLAVTERLLGADALPPAAVLDGLAGLAVAAGQAGSRPRVPGVVKLHGLDVEVSGGQRVGHAGVRGPLAAEVDPSALVCRGSA